MSFNSETFSLMLKFGGGMILVLLMIWLLAVATPHAAKLVDKLIARYKPAPPPAQNPPDPERVQDKIAAEYTVRDIYEGSPSETESENEKNDKKD